MTTPASEESSSSSSGGVSSEQTVLILREELEIEEVARDAATAALHREHHGQQDVDGDHRDGQHELVPAKCWVNSSNLGIVN